jgi:ribosome-binding protein aMBF1 (putative translation factor)
MTPAQCRAARGLLDWTRQRLADASHINTAIIDNFEHGFATPQNATLNALRRALEIGGVIFVDENAQGAGVRLRKTKTSGAAATIPIVELSAENDE